MSEQAAPAPVDSRPSPLPPPPPIDKEGNHDTVTATSDAPPPPTGGEISMSDPKTVGTSLTPAPVASGVVTTVAAAAAAATGNTPAALAALLATALADVDGLREQLAAERQRADRAERLAKTFADVSASLTGAPVATPGELVAPTDTNTTSTTPAPPTHLSLPPATVAHIVALEERTHAAERVRDDAAARLAAVSSNWAQLSSYLNVVDARAADARAGFARIVAEGGGRLVLVDVPMPAASVPASLIPYGYDSRGRYEGGYEGSSRAGYAPGGGREREGRRERRSGEASFTSLPLPPVPQPHVHHPHAEGGVEKRRQRTESIDAHGYSPHPTKRPRGDSEYDYHPPYPAPYSRGSFTAPTAPAPAPIAPHSHHRRSPERQGTAQSHSRARTRSPSTASDDIDALILDTTKASPRPHNNTAYHHGQAGVGRSPEWGATRAPERGGTLDGPAQPRGPPPPERMGSAGYSVAKKGTKDMFTYHTGPVVSQASVVVRSPTVPTIAALAEPHSPVVTTYPQAQAQPFPATNSANQRICRQCGQPGRYKEGKCVEKWGPGPLGPGTVCDRCRKKMKRVERRETLEQQQQQTGQAPAGGNANASRTPVQRTNTLPSNSGSGSVYRDAPHESSMRSSLAGSPSHNLSSASPAGAGRVIKSRLTPAPPAGGAGGLGLIPPMRTHSPMEVDDDDLDADAEAEVDEIDGDAEDGGDAVGDADGDAEADPEADLLEAVDAAEAASSSSNGRGGRMKSED